MEFDLGQILICQLQMFEIFEENYDEPIQPSIISIISRGILKEVNLLGAKKGRNM
jgi:hypothetical protein